MVQLSNYARKVGKKGRYEWYDWEVFVDEDEETLNKIEHVEYLLHPTFPFPRRVEHNKQSKFALKTRGWGEFTIKATIFFKDGSKERVSYELDFQKQWPEPERTIE